MLSFGGSETRISIATAQNRAAKPILPSCVLHRGWPTSCLPYVCPHFLCAHPNRSYDEKRKECQVCKKQQPLCALEPVQNDAAYSQPFQPLNEEIQSHGWSGYDDEDDRTHENVDEKFYWCMPPFLIGFHLLVTASLESPPEYRETQSNFSFTHQATMNFLQTATRRRVVGTMSPLRGRYGGQKNLTEQRAWITKKALTKCAT